MENWLLFLIFLLPAILTLIVVFRVFFEKRYFYKRIIISSYSLGFWVLQALMYFFSFQEGQDILGRDANGIIIKFLISIQYYWTWVYPMWIIVILPFSLLAGLIIYLIGKNFENDK
jgi:hypothetical protein